MSQALEQKLNEIKNQTKGLVTNLPANISPQMRNAHRQQAKNAYDRMNKLVPDYAAQLLKVTTFLVVTGDQAEEFAKAAEENAGCFIYNIENMFSDLTGKIAAINYVNRGYSSTLLF